MRRKTVLLAALALILLVGCTIDLGKPTPISAYNQATARFENAWNSYHTVWLALPKEDPRRAEWLREYHPKFQKAGKFLAEWGQNLTDPSKPVSWDVLEQEITAVLVRLAIQQGGK